MQARTLMLVAMFASMLQLSTARGQDASSGTDTTAGQIIRVVNIPPPQTGLQKVAMQKGVLVTKNYVEVATIAGEDDSNVQLVAVQMVAGGEKAYGIAFCVQRNGRYARVATSYVDENEIDGLMNALDQISRKQASGQATNTEFECTYQTRGDLTVGNVSNSGTRMLQVHATQVVIPSGEMLMSMAHFRLARVPELMTQINAAKQVIARFKNGGADPAEAGASGNK